MIARSYFRKFMFACLLVVCILSALIILGHITSGSKSGAFAAPDESGGPDQFGYIFLDSNEPDGPVYAWEEISTSGTLVQGWTSLDDGYAGPLSIGFDFNYYGTDFSELYISTNGYVSFGQGWGYIPGGMLPQPWEPNNDIAIFGGDMYLYDYGNESRVYYQVLTDPTRLVIEFINIHYCCGYNTPHTFEIIIYEDGDIQAQYLTLNGTSTDYVGIENSDGTDGLGYGTTLADQLAIRYYYPFGVFLTPHSQQGFGNPADTVAYTLQVMNMTDEMDSFNLSIEPGNVWTTTLSTYQVGPLGEGESASFTAWVDIPPGAQHGEADTATIQATSVNSPTLTSQAFIETKTMGDEIAYVTLEDSNLVALVDTFTQSILGTIETSSYGCYNPWRATMSPDKAFVYFGCYNSGSVLIVDTSTNSVVTNIPDIPYADDVAFTHFGDYALVGSRWSYQIAVIDTATFNVVQYIATNGNPRSIAIHPFLERAYATSGSGEILVIDTSTFTIINSIYVSGNPWDIAVSPDGAWVYTTDRNGSGVWVIDTNNEDLVTNINGTGELTGLEVSNDGQYIFAGGLYNEVWIIDASARSILTYIPINGQAWEVALTGDGNQLYVGNTTNQVVVIDAVNFILSGYINVPGDTTRGIAITPEFMAGGVGILEGHVYDEMENPIANSRVYTTPGPYQQRTDYEGSYHMLVVNGTYTVTAEAYGYFPSSAVVEIITDTTVTQDFYLSVAPLATVSGVVTDLSTGWPLYAYIAIENYPQGGVWTDPVTGQYSVDLPEGSSYKFTVSAWSPGYLSNTSIVGPVNGDLTVDLSLEADLESCDAPGYGIFPYEEDFEASDGGYTTEGYGGGDDSWEWGTPLPNSQPPYPGPSPYSGSNVWGTNLEGNYNDYENSWLYSPEIDLTPISGQPINLSWWQWLQLALYDSVNVMVSNDGGENWSIVYQAQNSSDTQWTQHSVVLDPTFGVTDFRIAFQFSSDCCQNSLGWYVDDVSAGSCQPEDGGLVVGNVYETRYGNPLIGADVSNDSGEEAVTQATIDPAVDDSFFILFSPAGSHDFTASYPGYNAVSELVDVIAGSTVLHDFYLPSGELVADPTALEANLDVGEIVTQTLMLNNIGDGFANFELVEKNVGYNPGQPILLGNTPGNEARAAKQEVDVLLIEDNDPWGVHAINTVLDDNHISYDQINASQMWDWDFSPYQMIIIPSLQPGYFYNAFNFEIAKFEQFIDSGGLLLLSACSSGEMVDLPFGGNSFTAYMYNDYLVEPGYPIFQGVSNPIYGNPASLNYLSGILPGDHLLVTAGFDPGGEPVMIEREHGQGMLVAGGLAYEIGWYYQEDAGKILMNMIPYYYFTWPTTRNATWLTEEPISGTVPAESSFPVEITFDATQANQPGDYHAALKVENDTPYGPFEIPVDMAVSPTADMGHVAGTVTDAWTGDPLTATVELEGVYTMRADPDYDIWAVDGAYSLTVYTSGYFTLTLPVEISAGTVTIQDVALEPALPKLGDLPAQIGMTLPTGSSGTQALDIINQGPLPLSFSFHEINPLKSLVGMDGLNGKHILYDMAHCQGDRYYYSTLSNDLLSAGASIDDNYDPIDESTLEGYDILWLSDGGCGWAYDELQVLDGWLASGGAIFIHNANSPATEMPASIFGVSYEGGMCTNYVTTDIIPHPVTEGVVEFYIDWNCGYITGSPEEIVLDSYGQTHVIAAEQGRGKMLVVAESDMNDYTIQYADNRLLAMNAFQWLSIPVYADIPWLSEAPEAGTIPGHRDLETTLTFDASDLDPGDYQGTLAIEHNDGSQDSPVLVPVKLTVLADVPPESVVVEGPDAGYTWQVYSFTAQVAPESTSLPITYYWEADGQLPITHTAGLTDEISFNWAMTGTQVITVTATNDFGSATSTYQIEISPRSFYLPLAQKSPSGGLERSNQFEIYFDALSESLTPILPDHRR